MAQLPLSPHRCPGARSLRAAGTGWLEVGRQQHRESCCDLSH
ncbi:hypothetical protein ACWHA1_16400 [Streptomyces decoyicus]